MATVAKRTDDSSEDIELRRGPWTLEEDTLLIHYIACHGEGRWNLLAKCAGKDLFSDMDYNFMTNTLILLLQFLYLFFIFFFLFHFSGLKRTGKSCRLRWLNYLKPDIKRGNLTPQEQLLILELHSKWGNR